MIDFNEALGASVRIGSPLLLAGMGELVLERAGMINIGIEGTMLVGAFGGFCAGWATQSPLIGACAGALAGAAFMLIFAGMSLKLRADQIVTGMAMNLIASGVTSSISDALSAAHPGGTLSVPHWSGLIEGWREAPPLGLDPQKLEEWNRMPAAFTWTALTWFALIAVPCIWFYFERTERGLELRAVGENPKAAQAAGINVGFSRLKACFAAGALCGLGGAFLTVSQTGTFAANCTSGRGFVALAAVVLGRYRAWGTAAACLLFGAAFYMRDAIPTSTAVVDLVEILPYALALAALCWKFKTQAAPGALGK